MKQHDLLAREIAIAFVKETFSSELCQSLSLTRVSSPFVVTAGSGINDDLNGTERAVSFPVKSRGEQRAVVVHSLAKWKRLRLHELGIPAGEGILTDMRALRPDEDYSPLHSIYVDQWDWEQHILPENRTPQFLKIAVEQIYSALRKTETILSSRFPKLATILPDQLTFIHTEELLQHYPDLAPKERENVFVREHGAVFLIGIGGKLSDGKRHDGRAPDYDDWTTAGEKGYPGLNGDLLVWHPVLECAFELSSMGIRVDPATLRWQLNEHCQEKRMKRPFHQLLLAGKLPQTIGGGIGQSRVCMFLLRKAHIGEVQVSLWPDGIREEMLKNGIELL